MSHNHEAQLTASIRSLRAEGRLTELMHVLEAHRDHPELGLVARCSMAEELLQNGDISIAGKLVEELGSEHELEPRVIALRCKLLAESGDTLQALSTCEHGLSLHPQSLLLLEFKGIALVALGQLDAAEATALTAIEISKSAPHTLRLSAHVLLHTNRPHQALELAQQAVGADPSSVLANYLLGDSALRLKQPEVAEQAFVAALRMKPRFREALIKLAQVYYEQFRKEDCHQSLLNAFEIGTPSAQDYTLLGHSYSELGKFDMAEEMYLEALRLKPNSGIAKTSLGNLCLRRNQLDKAIGFYMEAVLEEPQQPNSHLNLGLLLLLLGDYKSGWAEYEWRRLMLKAEPESLLEFPQLESLNDPHDHLLITSEQGIGDVVQFMRYAQFFRQRGVSTHLLVPKKLHALALSSDLFDSVHERVDEILPLAQPWRWVSIMSLPKILDVTRDNPQYATPYITIPSEPIQAWQAKINGDSHTPIIGIHWQGNPAAERGNLAGRSIPLKLFAPLFELDVSPSWVSLQKGHGAEQMDSFPYRDRLVPCQPLINDTWDFVETGAIMQNCDLIITTDSAVAHLAGAIGRPVWLLLTLVPDWRWGLEW